MKFQKDEILKKILDNMTVTPDGVIQLHGHQSSIYHRYLSLLISDLMRDNNLQSKLNSLRYCFTTKNYDVFFGYELNSIFKSMKQENKSAFSDFEEKLDLMLQKIETDSKPVKFELYYPLNIKTDEKVDMINYSEKFTKSKSNYKYIKVTMWSRNQNYAQETSTRDVNLILGFIAYSQNYQHSPISFTLNGILKALTELKLNYIFVFKEGVYSGSYSFEDKSDDKKEYDLSSADIKNLNEFVKQFNSADKKIQYIIYKAISLYYLGLIEKSINYSFLNFWTALEIIAIKKKGIPHIEIIKRLKSVILKYNNPIANN